MTEGFKYKKSRFNIVAIAIVLLLAGGAYLAYVFVPVRMRASEAMRVLDETSSEFTGQSSRMLADRKVVDKLRRDMIGDLQAVGITDPQAEHWIEIDDANTVRFGVLYSDWIELPFSEPRERVHELEMLCTRPGHGAGWTCESRDLRSNGSVPEDQLVEPGT